MIGIAVLGAGKAGTLQLNGWRSIPNARVVGVYEPDPDRARRATETFGIRAYADARALLEAPGVDAADIASATETHRELVRLASGLGKQILCQKPLSTSYEDAVGLVRDCEDAGVRLMANENWRRRPWYRMARAILDAGTLGRLTYLRQVSRGPQRDYPLLLNTGPHQLDVVRYLFGEPTSIFARSMLLNGKDGDDTASVSLGFPDRMAVVDFNWSSVEEPGALHSDTLTIEGTEGVLHLAMTGAMRIVRRDGTVVPVIVDTADYYQRSFTSGLAHFVDALESGAPFETPGRENLKTLRLVFEAYRSASEGRAVALHP